jgi:hypothetical protein
VLNRQASAGTWNAATYCLSSYGAAELMGHRTHRTHRAASDTVDGNAAPTPDLVTPMSPMSPMPYAPDDESVPAGKAAAL